MADGLATYRKRRDFTRTGEPRGASRFVPGTFLYSGQKHAARRTHFDLRLELGGVLKSWAVTRGPSLDPSKTRLAVATEDHPLDYIDFEGTIPQGEYGGGAVMLWDFGRWRPVGDPEAGLRQGKLSFDLYGARLRGGWTLVRTDEAGKGREQWLLRKRDDGWADPTLDLVEKYKTSIATGRSLVAIGAGKAPARQAARRFPRFHAPALATPVETPPDGAWLHEIKFDGYRVQASVAGGEARLFTRSGEDWTTRLMALAGLFAAFPARSALIDGEVVVPDERGRTDFASLQRALKEREPLVYYAFDLLEIDGKSLRSRRLLERKQRLRDLVADMPPDLRYSDHLEGNGADTYERACELGVEGIVSKRPGAPYRSGRRPEWLKSKCLRREEVVIGGWRKSGSPGRPFASLIAGNFENGELAYRGRIGTGFSREDQEEIAARLSPLTRKTPPFRELPDDARHGATWVSPSLVAEVSYTERTPGGVMRQPVFLGLRDDKPAREVRAENEVRAPAGKLSNPDKVLYPEVGLTKHGLATHLDLVSDRMLAHLARRPILFLRCPEGIAESCFFQKHRTPGMPSGLKPVEIAEKPGTLAEYFYVEDAAGLAAAAQMGVLELHVWGSRIGSLEKPDRMVFDLDPDEGLPFAEVKDAAGELHDVLAAAQLTAFPLLTGGKGIHVVVPLAPLHPWDHVTAFARGLAQALARARPDRYVAKASKQARRGRIFLDWMRNQRGATAIAPFSPRARPGAPVAVPVSWSQLDRIEGAAAFSVATVKRRLATLERDPWEEYFELEQTIGGEALKALKVGR